MLSRKALGDMLGSRRFYLGQSSLYLQELWLSFSANSSFVFKLHTNTRDKPVGEFDISVKYHRWKRPKGGLPRDYTFSSNMDSDSGLESLYTSKIAQKPFQIGAYQS